MSISDLEREGGWSLLDVNWSASENVWDSFSTVEFEAAMRMSSVIYACVRKIATVAPDVPMEIGMWDGDSWEPDTKHPDLNLLRQPNSTNDWRMFCWNWIGHLLVTGESWVWKQRNKAGEITSMHAVPSSSVSSIVDKKTGDIKKYRIGTGDDAKAVEVLPEDMFVMLYPDMTYPGTGVGPLQACLRDLQIDNSRAAQMIEILTQMHFAGLVVSQDAPMSSAQKRDIRSRVRDKIGPGKRGDVLFLAGQGAKAEFQRPPADLDWPGTANLSESRICCLPGTKVLTKRGVIPIENVRLGDLVLTHRGRWRPVVYQHVNPVHDGVSRIRAKGFDPLCVTNNHPVYVGTYSQSRNHSRFFEGIDWIPAGAVRPHKCRGSFHAMSMPPSKPGGQSHLHVTPWVREKRFLLSEKHGMLVSAYPHTKPIPASIPFSAALGRIVGFYLAEGSQGSGKSRFSFHIDECVYQQMVSDDIASVFGLTTSTVDLSNCRTVICQSAILADLLACGTARTKIIPEWAWDGTIEFMEAMLWAWSVGDGSYIEECGSHSVGTVSESLAWQMRAVATSCGHVTALRRDKNLETGIIKGREVRRARFSYRLTWRTRPAEQNGAYSIESGYLMTAVKDRIPVEYDGLVYNLGVYEDESYFTTGGMVHNCAAFGIPPILLGLRVGLDASTYSNYGLAKTSFYQDTMEPLWKWMSSTLERGMYRNEGKEEEVEPNLDDVPELQEDVDAIHARAREDYHAGLITKNRALEILGEPTIGKAGDIYALPMNIIETPAGQLPLNTLPPEETVTEVPTPTAPAAPVEDEEGGEEEEEVEETEEE